MEVDHNTDAIRAATCVFGLETVESDKSLQEVFRLRYQIYCLERRFESGQDGMETDAFDAMSRHVLLRHRPTGKAIGTVRLIIPRLKGPGALLPIEQFANPPRLWALRRSCVAEVSRFALSKELRAASRLSGSLARLLLIRGLVQLSYRMGLTHWCALMEPKLLRLLAASGIHFVPLDGLVEHHGLRQPSVTSVDEMLHRVRYEQPAVWNLITGDGTLWRDGLSSAA